MEMFVATDWRVTDVAGGEMGLGPSVGVADLTFDMAAYSVSLQNAATGETMAISLAGAGGSGSVGIGVPFVSLSGADSSLPDFPIGPLIVPLGNKNSVTRQSLDTTVAFIASVKATCSLVAATPVPAVTTQASWNAVDLSFIIWRGKEGWWNAPLLFYSVLQMAVGAAAGGLPALPGLAAFLASSQCFTIVAGPLLDASLVGIQGGVGMFASSVGRYAQGPRPAPAGCSVPPTPTLRSISNTGAPGRPSRR
jgi:hypothetical protein